MLERTDGREVVVVVVVLVWCLFEVDGRGLCPCLSEEGREGDREGAV